MTPGQWILAILLLLQAILVAFFFWPRPAVEADSGPLLAGLDPEAVASLVIADNNGRQVRLEHKGEAWFLPDAGNYQALAENITPVLAKLAAIDAGRLVTHNETSQRQLQVADDDFLRRIELETTGGDRYTLYMGSATNPSATPVRRGGASEAYLTGEIATWEINADPSDWIDTTYVDLDREAISRLALSNAQGDFTFEMTAEGEWRMVGQAGGDEETLILTAVNGLAGRVANLLLLEPLGLEELPEYGLDEPLAALQTTVTTAEGEPQEYRLQVGAHDPESNTYVVKWSDSPYYVRVSGFAVDELVNNGRDAFIQAPEPEATPAP